MIRKILLTPRLLRIRKNSCDSVLLGASIGTIARLCSSGTGRSGNMATHFVYILDLVLLTLLLPFFRLGSAIYLLGAVALGSWLFSSVWKISRQGSNKLAWKMYRYSSMYLAFLFLILIVDVLLG